MNNGPPNIFGQLNKGIDYIQSSYNVSDGVTKITPSLIFKGVVIDVDLNALKSTSFASIVPPFSVYAKLIGVDDDVEDPLANKNKIYYPPLFPMHTICIPEIGEEVLILKENSEFSSQGYYIGRINDSSPLNISYARDYMGINDPETDNRYRYGFSFDVRELRKKFENKMPSAEFSNVSIPMTYGDVVQQGRTKTYLRHSFNMNNKKGVLEQGIRMDGQLTSKDKVSSFDYDDTSTPASVAQIALPDGESPSLYKPATLRSIDPSIGATKTKTIHFVDSSIRRLGDYTYQSLYGNKQTGGLEGDDKGMIVNIAEEIYNISSRNVSGALYRQVLGEKLVIQQQQTLNLMKEVMNTVSDFASSTQLLLDAFLDHTHALPKIELNLEKTIDIKDSFRTPPTLQQQPNLNVSLPDRLITIPMSDGNIRRVYVPGGKTSIPQPPKIVNRGRIRTKIRKQEINFDAIIGGEENPRFTAPVQTEAQSPQSMPLPGAPSQNIEKTDLGIKTGEVDIALEEVINKFTNQRERLNELTLKVNQFLSKNQFVN
tara:strand:+ start:213 stop:1838 length:1626 start_codon:yes stop_codon:yes gene_type:complete